MTLMEVNMDIFGFNSRNRKLTIKKNAKLIIFVKTCLFFEL